MKILDIKITTLSKKQLLEKISERISQQKKTVVFTPNPEIIELASTENVGDAYMRPLPNFVDILNKADFNLADGTGLKIACFLKAGFANFFHLLLPTPYSLLPFSVIHGIDFMLDLCFEAEKNNWTIGLLGGMDNVANKTKSALLQRFPNLQINYVYGNFEYKSQLSVPCSQFSDTSLPVFGQPVLETDKPKTDKLSSDNRKPITDNRNIPAPTSHLDLLFVALGTPKEQLWISQNRNSFPATVFMQVGGSFDILSGRLHRAPLFLRKLGLEWLFRLIQEPRRISRQLNLIKFLWAVLTTKNSITN